MLMPRPYCQRKSVLLEIWLVAQLRFRCAVLEGVVGGSVSELNLTFATCLEPIKPS